MNAIKPGLSRFSKDARTSAQPGGFDAAAYVAQTLARHGLNADGTSATSSGLPGGFGSIDLSALTPGRSGGFGGIDLSALTTGLPGGSMGTTPLNRETFTCAAGSRDYTIDLPEGPARGLVLMLHGCTQTPEDFAGGTGMSALAAAEGLITVYPAQNRGANAQSCWNWFSPGDQRRDRGEPAILAALVRDVMARHAVPEGRVYVAGLSAGAAMAVILGHTHGDLFAAVGAHSGLPYGSARTVAEAFQAMGGQPSHPGGPSNPVPTIVFHGDGDTTVNPANSTRIITDATPRFSVSEIVEDGTTKGRAWRRSSTLDAAGAVLSEDWRIAGLGHAWSGGGAGSYADPAGPNASAEMLRFFLLNTAGKAKS